MKKLSEQLFEDKKFVNVPLDYVFKNSISEHLKEAINGYDEYAKNKFGEEWDTTKVMQEKGAKIVISSNILESDVLTITLTNGYNPYK